MITRHGRVAHLDAYGLADIENDRPMTEDIYFYLYSMTKPVASAALLILYEEGKFQLTDPVANYLPELANARVFDREAGLVVDAARQPTIQDVFRHTAGYLYGPAGRHGFRPRLRRSEPLGGNAGGVLAEVRTSCRSATSRGRSRSTPCRTTSRRAWSRCSRA